ncbi:MAG TPA: hypothetical protein VHV82_08755 [Sporichthyaceae bacterium]|jgi:hypothetical protein|nr:hypothetical protein [Sporichthyaceae bacterium]
MNIRPVIAATNGPSRWLWLVHPTVTAVTATANHYWLDSIVACILLVIVCRMPIRSPGGLGLLRTRRSESIAG